MRGLLLVTAAALCGSPFLSVTAQVRRVVPPAAPPAAVRAGSLELPLTRGGRAPLEDGSALVGEIQGREIRWVLRGRGGGGGGELLRVFPAGSRAYRDANDQVTVVWAGGMQGLGRISSARQAPAPTSVGSSRVTADRAVVTANAVRAMRGAKPRLGFGLYKLDQHEPSIGTGEIDVYRVNLAVTLAWEGVNVEQFNWRWQVASQPFPEDASFDPPGLLASGPADPRFFRIGLGTFPPLGTGRLTVADAPMAVAPPASSSGRGAVRAQPSAPGRRVAPDRARDFYIRIIAVQNGAPYGLGSNVVVAHYHPGPPPRSVVSIEPEVSAELSVMRPAAKIYRLEFAGFQPLVFEDPNRWGCVYVDKNPYALMFAHPLSSYQAGKEYCPPNDPAHQEKTTWQWIETGVTGWVKAYEIMSDFYNDTKGWIADKFATIAVPCGWLGDDAASTCHDLAAQAAGTAMSAGLVAVGVPPTLPSIEGLQDAGKEKFGEAAADYTCQIFESNGGECTPAMRTGLEEAYKQGLNQLQHSLRQQASEPGCGDAAAAKDNGKLPLPCFTAFEGTEVRPATGSIQEWPIVTVRVTQIKANPPFPMPPCRVSVNFQVSNHFPGGYLGGAMVQATDMSGFPFESAEASIPAMALGESRDVPLVFSKIVPFRVPGHQALPQGMSTDWLYLYVGGTGPIHSSSNTIAPVVGAKSYGRDQVLDCAERTEATIEIPKVP